MTGLITSWQYIKGEKAELVQGFKGHSRPARALYGSNGSFIVAGEPPKLLVTIQLENGNTFKENVYYMMKEAGCSRVTANRAYILGMNLVGKKVVYEDGECTNLQDLVNEYMKYSM